MAKLDPEILDRIRTSHLDSVYGNVEAGIAPTQAERDRGALLNHIAAQDTEIATLVAQVRNQAAELEDTRAAYQLTRHQLDAHRAGQGTYEGITR